MRMLVTGFGAFGDIAANPSSSLAESCGCEHVLLEVSFDSAPPPKPTGA